MNKKKVLNLIFNIVIIVGLVLSCLIFAFKLSFVKVVVNGTSMNPTIDNGTVGYMVKVNKNTKIERFDVVASKYLDEEGSYIIKRVLGLPNEEVKLVDNTLYVNGNEIPQEFSFIPRNLNFSETSWTLQEDEYLLVGDNRAATINPVVEKKEEIISKNGFAIYTYDINSSSCENHKDYSGCEIDNRKWYYLKDGK